jgi:hypothetical protein
MARDRLNFCDYLFQLGFQAFFEGWSHLECKPMSPFGGFFYCFSYLWTFFGSSSFLKSSFSLSQTGIQNLIRKIIHSKF